MHREDKNYSEIFVKCSNKLFNDVKDTHINEFIRLHQDHETERLSNGTYLRYIPYSNLPKLMYNYLATKLGELEKIIQEEMKEDKEDSVFIETKVESKKPVTIWDHATNQRIEMPEKVLMII